MFGIVVLFMFISENFYFSNFCYFMYLLFCKLCIRFVVYIDKWLSLEICLWGDILFGEFNNE